MNANCLLNLESGAGGNRTLVRSKHQRAFYMFSCRICFIRAVGRLDNTPRPQPYLFGVRQQPERSVDYSD